MNFNIHSSAATLQKYARQNKIDYSDNSSFDDLFKNTKFASKKQKSKGKIIDIKDIKLNDSVYVTLIPNSQQHIPNYPSITGSVFFIDIDEDDLLIYNHESQTIYSLKRPCCSMYSTSDKGYYYVLEKI